MPAPGDPRDLAARLEALTSPVRLVLFTQTFGCETCFEARRTVDEIARLSDRIRVEEHNLVLDAERVAEYGAERAPALAIVGEKDLGLRYYGAPAGYEIESVVSAIEVAGGAGPPLSDESVAALEALDRPLGIQVFVTPT
jgi:alkyl hydroperoxide reductase subunit AhpF